MLAPLGYDGAMPDLNGFREGLKRVAVVLKESGVPFALAGGYAAWARGAPEAGHDVDFLVPPAESSRSREELARRGLDVRQPPEDWLFKVDTDGVTVDVIHRTSGTPLEDALARATETEVLSVRMPVLTATDVTTEKLLAMDEHYCDFGALLPTVRALREQVDWDEVRRRSAGHAFAEAFLFLLERLDVVAASERSAHLPIADAGTG
jgi:hypothetical protein